MKILSLRTLTLYILIVLTFILTGCERDNQSLISESQVKSEVDTESETVDKTEERVENAIENANGNSNGNTNKNTDENTKEYSAEIGIDSTEDDTEVASYQLIDSEGDTLLTRINPPVGYKRIVTEEGTFQDFMRGLTLKKDDSKVLLYNGEEKGNQSAHAAIFDFDIGTSDLQQCADSIMRVYGEYLWSIGDYDKIKFHLTNGFLMEYTKWRDGNRIHVEGNNVSWRLTNEYDDSYDSFRKYMSMVFVYAGTLSLSEEGELIALEVILPGDMFIYGGSPGHCVLVVDVAQNLDGDKCFLLAQGYMPAQNFHVLKNPLHEGDPWYYESEAEYPLKTPQWTFDKDSLKRWLD